METQAPPDRLNGAASRPASLFFQPPAEEPPAPRTSPEQATGEGTLPPPALTEDDLPAGFGSGSADEWSDDGTSDEPGPSSSAASSPANPIKVASQATLRATTRRAVVTARGMAHRFGTRSEGQRAIGLYLADQQDAEGIGDPLASILHRRGGLVGKELSADAAEGMQVLMALGGYVSKQVVKAQQAAEVDRHLAAGGTLEDLT